MIDENEQSEEKRKDKKEESELAGLRVSLIEAKVALEKGELAVEALSQKVRKKKEGPLFFFSGNMKEVLVRFFFSLDLFGMRNMKTLFCFFSVLICSTAFFARAALSSPLKNSITAE